jgi:uncharacterized RmlC-like cupin family protein
MLEKTLHQPNPSESFHQKTRDLVIVRPDPQILSSQSSLGFVGLSANTAGTTGIAIEIVILPPGAIAKPHIHPDHETVLYLLKGRVEVCYGEGLKQCEVCEAGDFVFTPPNVPHQPRNLSATEPVYAIAARNTPEEHEKSIPYDPEV